MSPAHVYKGGRRRRPALEGARQVWGVLLGLPSPSRIPLFLSRVGEKKEGKREGVGKGKGGAAPFPLVQFGPMGGRAPPSLWPASSIPIWPNKAQYFSRRIPVTLRYSEKYPNHSEPFRCPNIALQYIDLYVSTISRLLVISPISSGTSDSLRYIKTHKLII